MPTKTALSPVQAKRLLVKAYERGGYVRYPNDTRRQEGANAYKKGYEIRLVADTRGEVAAIRRALHKLGLKSGKPYQKHNQWVQPIYGRQSMDRFCSWLEELG